MQHNPVPAQVGHQASRLATAGSGEAVSVMIPKQPVHQARHSHVFVQVERLAHRLATVMDSRGGLVSVVERMSAPPTRHKPVPVQVAAQGRRLAAQMEKHGALVNSVRQDRENRMGRDHARRQARRQSAKGDFVWTSPMGRRIARENVI